MAINDVLPLKAARRYAIANAKWLLGPRDANDHDLISMVSFTFAIRRHLIRLSSAPFTSFCLTQLGLVPFANLRVTPGNEAEHRIYRGCSKTQVLFQSFCGPKFMNPSYFSTLLPDCLCHVSFRRQLPLSLEVVKKPNKCIVAPNFLGTNDLDLLAQFTVHHLAKFG